MSGLPESQFRPSIHDLPPRSAYRLGKDGVAEKKASSKLHEAGKVQFDQELGGKVRANSTKIRGEEIVDLKMEKEGRHRPVSDETRAKLRESRKGKSSGMKNKTHTPKARENMSSKTRDTSTNEKKDITKSVVPRLTEEQLNKLKKWTSSKIRMFLPTITRIQDHSFSKYDQPNNFWEVVFFIKGVKDKFIVNNGEEELTNLDLIDALETCLSDLDSHPNTPNLSELFLKYKEAFEKFIQAKTQSAPR